MHLPDRERERDETNPDQSASQQSKPVRSIGSMQVSELSAKQKHRSAKTMQCAKIYNAMN